MRSRGLAPTFPIIQTQLCEVMRILPTTAVLSLAGHGLVLTTSRFKPLAMAFIVPELVRRLYSWAQAYIAARLELPSVTPGWFDSLIYESLTAIVFVAIIRYIASGERPQLDPRTLPPRTVALTAALLIVVWLPLDHMLDRHTLYKMYLDYNSMHLYSPSLAADAHRVWLSLGVATFALAAVASALMYPMVGIIAVTNRIDFRSWQRMLNRNLPALLLLSAVLIAALVMAKDIYFAILHYLLPGVVSYAPVSLSDFDGRLETLHQLQYVPLNYLFEVLPAVLVGLLMRGLLPTPQPQISP
jgi:hypothetical protein